MALEEWCLSSGDQISEQIIQTSSEPTNWPTPDMDAYSPCHPASRHRLLFKGPRLLLSRRKLRWSISLAILWRHSPNQYRRDIPRTGSSEASRESGAIVVAITAEANSANVLVKTGYYLPAVAFLKHGLRASRSLGSAEATSGQLTVWGWLLVHTGRTNLALRLTTHASHFADASHLNASILEIMTLRA